MVATVTHTPMSFFRKYNHFVKTKPLATNIVSTGFLFGVGDVMAQGLQIQAESKGSDKLNKDRSDKLDKNENSSFDFQRTFRAVAYGSLIFAPLADKWFRFLPKVKVVRKSKSINTVARVAMDQLGFAPFVGIPLYFSVMTWMEGVMAQESNIGEKIQAKLSTSYFDTLKSNWAVWPAVQLINFAFVPVGMRLLVVNVVSIGWNCFLSMQMNGSSEELIFD